MMENTKEALKSKILVLGATGKTGSRVLQRLKKMEVPVQSGSRLSDPGFDWDDETTWEAVLQNIHTVYLSFQPDLAVPGAPETVKAFAEKAVKTGVRKLVLLSGRGEPEAEQCEEAVMNAGAEWTIIRASWFCQNFSEGHFLEPVLAGHVALPAGDIREPFVDTDDIADVAVEALTKEGHHGKIYEVTGPRLLSFREAVAEIAEATGKSIHYEQVSMSEYAGMLTGYGVPAEIISLITYLFTEVLDGRNAMLCDGIQQALGRTPTDFSEYARKASAKGVWDN